MRINTAVLALALPFATACTSLTAADTVDIRFTSSIVSGPSGEPIAESVTAAGGAGAIVVVGTVLTSSPCYALSPIVERDGQRIVATITASESLGCVAAPTAYTYTLRIGNLQAGDFHLTVNYDVRATTSTSLWTPFDAMLRVE